MSYISRYNPQDFLVILRKLEEGTPETIVQFPLEYYVGDSIIFLYKQVMSKIYKTAIISKDNRVNFDNKDMSVEEFINILQTNHNGFPLLAPLETDNEIKLNIIQESSQNP